MISLVCHHKEPIISRKIQVGLTLSQITLVAIGILFFLKVGQVPRFVGLNCIGGAALLFMADAIARCRSKEIPLQQKIIKGLQIREIKGKYYLKIRYGNTTFTQLKKEKFEILFPDAKGKNKTLNNPKNETFSFFYDKPKDGDGFNKNSLSMAFFLGNNWFVDEITITDDKIFECRPNDLEQTIQKYLNGEMTYRNSATIKD